MAGKKTSIQVDVTGDARSAIKALGQVTARMGTMQQKAVAVGSAIGNVLANGVRTAINAIGDLGGEVMKQSDSIQKFQSTMGFAGFDTSAIEAATKATKDYADSTVYDLTTVQSTTAQLAANGVKDYVGLTKAAGNLNAVAGGNADTFRSVAMVLTQTAGAGKLTTENWNQLADAIPGASGKLQEAMAQAGAYTGNFREAMEAGEITADEFSQAIMSLGMTDVAKQAATSTATMEGALGSLEASITGGLAGAFNLIKPMVTGAISGASQTISEFSTTATAAIQTFLTALSDTGVLQTAKTMIDSVGQAISTLGGAFMTIAQTIAPGLQGLGDAGTIGQTVGTAFNTAAGVIQTVANALTTFGNWVSANAEPIATALVGIGTGFAVFKVASIIQTVSTALQGFSIATTAATAAQWLMNAAMNANPIMLVVTAIGALVGALTYFFTQTETGRQIWSSFTSFIGGCVDGIVGFFSSLPDKIGGFFQNAANMAQNAWNGITGFFSNIWNGITNGVQNVVNKIGNAFNNAVNAVKNAFNGVVSFVQGIWDTISGIIGSITSGVQGAWDTITSILPFSLAPAAMPMAAAIRPVAHAAPLVTVGDPDMQGASRGAGTGLARLARLLGTSNDGKPTVVNNVTYNVTLPARMMVGSKSELIQWIKQGLREAERQRN